MSRTAIFVAATLAFVARVVQFAANSSLSLDELALTRNVAGRDLADLLFGYGDARFFAREGHLWIEHANGTDAMLYQGNDTFGFEGDAERLVFERSPTGEVVAARWVNETWQGDPGERIPPEKP